MIAGPLRVSVVVPTRDRPAQLARLLASLDSLVGLRPVEVIVVDGSTANGTRIVLNDWADRSHGFDARVVRQQSPSGPAQARNLGIVKAGGDVIAFTDDDCQVHSHWLWNLSRKMYADAQTLGVGGRVLPRESDLLSRYYTFHRILEPPKSLLYLVSANCCYDRRAILSVGGFDEEVRWPGGEDVGVSFKLSKVGCRFAFAEGAIVYHDYRNNLLDFLKTFRNYGIGCRQVTEKHFGKRRAQ